MAFLGLFIQFTSYSFSEYSRICFFFWPLQTSAEQTGRCIQFKASLPDNCTVHVICVGQFDEIIWSAIYLYAVPMFAIKSTWYVFLDKSDIYIYIYIYMRVCMRYVCVYVMSISLSLSLAIYITYTNTHTHVSIYIYIYIYMCVCVCVCVSLIYNSPLMNRSYRSEFVIIYDDIF